MSDDAITPSCSKNSAACGEEWEAAEEYVGTALRQADELPHVMAQYDTRRWWAWMLLRRDETGDRERARTLLEEAIAGYQKLEAPLLEQCIAGGIRAARVLVAAVHVDAVRGVGHRLIDGDDRGPRGRRHI